MAKMTIMRGLPASGKTTKALELMKVGNTVRINKDSLRTMLHGDIFTGLNEKITREVSQAIAAQVLMGGMNVIIDDTNLNPKTLDSWIELARINDYKVEIISIDTPVEECINRDLDREKYVGESVIQKMALQYLDYMKGQKVIICDLDGTLCDIEHRLKYASGEEKDWKKFFEEIPNDTIRKDVLEKLVAEVKDDVKLVFVSARPEKYRSETEEWLLQNQILSSIKFPAYEFLIMREDNDKRDDVEVKRDIYTKYLKNLDIIKIFDDRPRVIKMWRELGLEVEDVGKGIEF